ncbi:MAG: outer membrane lipoprotein-sorting protein [Pseudomonadota bacterium]|nr:outer membrane lipoprotein-sorting protein [Pseudomonadota bacterium]
MNGRVCLFPKQLAVMVLALLFSASLLAETNAEKGLAIAKESELRGDGFGDFTAAMEMILKNRQGDTSTRYIRILGLEVPGDGDKSLSIFDEPADVRGTAMLTYSHKSGPDDQWLYLPALKRVKRIASDNKSGPYMGSEFAYEDIASQELEKYTYQYLRDEVFDGVDCFVVERIPVDENSGYKRQVVWLDKAEYRPLKTDFYDRKDVLLKTLINTGYKKYLQHHWRPDEMFMENVQNGKTTRILWKNYRFNTGLVEKDFQVNDLRRAR